jgi:hypothetical protein
MSATNPALYYITECNKYVEHDHGLIFLKTEDNVVHALEFGHHHALFADTWRQGAPPDLLDATQLGPRAVHDPTQYTVKLWNPWSAAPKSATFLVPGPKHKTWKNVVNPWTLDSLNRKLNTEWYKEHVGAFVFESETTFVDHVMSLLTEPADDY